MSSTNDRLSGEDKATLLGVARQSIKSGLIRGCPLEVESTHYPLSLRPLRATFVTLKIDGQLRGCIGALEPRLPLVVDVAEHAYAAAFEDPRFRPLQKLEFPLLEVHISVLSPPEPIQCGAEDELLEQLRPGIDGLILRLGEQRATFLPSVWEDVRDPYVFLAQLKRKAGLPLDYWSEALELERYTTEAFGDCDLATQDLSSPS
jgi:AmmeMemoRadiSam system protein A